MWLLVNWLNIDYMNFDFIKTNQKYEVCSEKKYCLGIKKVDFFKQFYFYKKLHILNNFSIFSTDPKASITVWNQFAFPLHRIKAAVVTVNVSFEDCCTLLLMF